MLRILTGGPRRGELQSACVSARGTFSRRRRCTAREGALPLLLAGLCFCLAALRLSLPKGLSSSAEFAKCLGECRARSLGESRAPITPATDRRNRRNRPKLQLGEARPESLQPEKPSAQKHSRFKASLSIKATRASWADSVSASGICCWHTLSLHSCREGFGSRKN